MWTELKFDTLTLYFKYHKQNKNDGKNSLVRYTASISNPPPNFKSPQIINLEENNS